MSYLLLALLPFGLATEHADNPVGIDVRSPRLSWMAPTGVVAQTAYEIEYPGGSTGKVVSRDSVGVLWPGPELVSSSRYGWRVRIWDENDHSSEWSGRATFTTGIMRPDGWKAKWIGARENDAPVFAKVFNVRKPPVRATFHVTGVGFYEAYLNGEKIGDKVLDPSPTAYDRRVLYSTYLLDGKIRSGKNEIRIAVGHGWYDMRTRDVWRFDQAPWRGFPRAIAQLRIEYADGTEEMVSTDATWRQVPGFVRYDDIREGEVLSSALHPPIRDEVDLVDGPCSVLVAESHPGAHIVETVAPEAIYDLPDGSQLVSFPRQLAGWTRIVFHGGRQGDIVAVRYDDRVDDGPCPAGKRHIDKHVECCGSTNVCAFAAGVQTDRFILSGNETEAYEPHFTYHGYRYVWIRGHRQKLSSNDVQGCAIRTGYRRTGRFACSSPVIMRLMAAVRNAYDGNFVDGYPTDCPHREKNGWTGDAQLACEFAQYDVDNTAAYEKWVRDIIDAQRPDGNIPGIVPTSGWGYEWGNGPAWDAALTEIPWALYLFKGDKRIVEVAYPAIIRYLSYTARQADADGLVRHGLGDWVPVKKEHAPSNVFTSSCYYLAAQRIAAEMARIQGMTEDAKRLSVAAEITLAGLRKRFSHGNGVWENGLQTAQAMALSYGLPEDESARVAVGERLVEACEKTGRHCDFGVLGSKWVFRALSEIGRGDIAYDMIVNPTEPSFAHMLSLGDDSLWESWRGGSSRNHVMFGDFAAWAYGHLAGIRPMASGFREVLIAPETIPQLSWLSASIETPYGRVSSEWSRMEDGNIRFVFCIPPNVVAKVNLPGRSAALYGAGSHEIVVESAGEGSSGTHLAK